MVQEFQEEKEAMRDKDPTVEGKGRWRGRKEKGDDGEREKGMDKMEKEGGVRKKRKAWIRMKIKKTMT